MERILTEETLQKIGQTVKLAGWINGRRDHGQIVFVDLRDVSGIAQVVFAPEKKELYGLAQKLRPEWVIEIEGVVRERPKGSANSKLATGEIEIEAQRLKIFNEAKTLPFEIETQTEVNQGEGKSVSEEVRMKYRYLDLRRARMKNNLILRHRVIDLARHFLAERGFIEVETPILTKSTPEGARDYLVPSRLQPGSFYALPQSPQQYKQLLMVAGLEKYFQIARCFRDEDTRGDRQAEFTQLDLEMSFVEQEDILRLVEELYVEIVKNIVPDKKIKKIPFPRLTYQEAIKGYQSDKPDLRQNKNDFDELAFAFVVDFPMFEWRQAEKRFDAVHHPFTRPQTDETELIKEKPAEILAYQYDVVCNGYEIGGGSLRSFRPEVLEAVFQVLGHQKEEVHQKFGHLLQAFEYGSPPHGGIALGLDRFLMILANESSIREVIAFPKTGDGRDLMMGAPAEAEEKQLKELRIKIIK